MPWEEVSVMSQRREFVRLAQGEGPNLRDLCRRFGISPTTGYKWLERFHSGGEAALADLPRRPHHSPRQTCPKMEELMLKVRDAHPAWGGRKLQAYVTAQGHRQVPSPSTITAILRRHGRIDPTEGAKHRAWQRFEHQEPNQLWQMDFKGHFALREGRCHPLTVLDDHSRFSLGLEACGDERTLTVHQRLTNIFRRYGLPERMVMDNGAPWGLDANHHHTLLTVWLLRLGIGVSHGRPYHPQTQGKDERFHRTLALEVLRGAIFQDLGHCQEAFDSWREVYNLERPHQALGMAVPASRYQVSPRPFPDQLPPVEYGTEDKVRRVQDQGWFTWKARNVKVSAAFKGMKVAIKPTTIDGLWDVFFMTNKLCQIDLRQPVEYV